MRISRSFTSPTLATAWAFLYLEFVLLCHPRHAEHHAALTLQHAKTKAIVMSIKTDAAIGPSINAGMATQPSVVTDTYGANFARRYCSVMIIFAYLVEQRAGLYQPLTLTT